MNALTNKLPATVTIDGVDYPINTDFRAGIEYELLAQSGEATEEVIITSLELYYGDNIPINVDAALERIDWFYRCGKPLPENVGNNYTNGAQAYSFEHDDQLIYAAFLSQYKIDIGDIDMHWWKFRSMFQSLNDSNRIVEIMAIRTMKLDKLPKEQKEFYRAMQQKHAFPRSQEEIDNQNELVEALQNGGNIQEILNRKK